MNVNQLNARLRTWSEKTQRKALTGLLQGGHEIVATSVRLTPKDTGNLRRQQSAEILDSNTVFIFVDAEYAMRVHEDLEAYHRVGQAKYLETAVNQERRKVLELAAKAAQL